MRSELRTQRECQTSSEETSAARSATTKEEIAATPATNPGDAGVALWKLIADQGHHFLMRVGSNVTLLRKLGYCRESHAIVYCWPNKAARSKQPPLVGLWMIQLFAVKEQLAVGQPPTRSSAAMAIHAIREVFHSWSEIPSRGTSLKSKLRHAITDQYERSKKSKQARYRPDNKDKPHGRRELVQQVSCGGA